MGELRFDDQVVIVTGAGRGLGRSYARLLAERGAAVVVNDTGADPDGGGHSRWPAEGVAEEIRLANGRAVASTASVSSEDGAGEIVATALDSFGRIDAVINNAGIFAGVRFASFDAEVYRRHLDVHVLGSALVLRAAWPHLARTGGRVVNTISGSLFGLPGYSAYIAAKGGLFGLTRALAVEGREAGIKVNCIAPGAATRLAAQGLPDMTASELKAFERAMPPEAVAPVAAFLVHETCPLNGECLSVAGGRVTRYILAETPGVTIPGLTVETVRDNLERIMDTGGCRVWPDAEALSASLDEGFAASFPTS